MAYQALARKWRPRNFNEVVGQEHVIKALTHALEFDRLHHAYLFTGTRGVGKTTLARILAKAMNCEARVGYNPCGECLLCREADEGRLVDMIEVDAASRTKVEDTRDLLENVQYAPNQGRFKVYIIDEVHMLSGHSFNALLKTLEEPPPHVKFLLATTDPQKIPVTVLSRCLQFNLKRLTPEQIRLQMESILGREGIAFAQNAIRSLSRAADGSMRDGLSLLDQAIVHGGGSLEDGPVSAMLGTVSRSPVFGLLDALANHDAAAMLQQVDELAVHSPNFADVLQQLLIVLHHAAMAQWVPDAVRHDDDAERILALAKRLRPEDVQLFYQIGLLGQRDLPLAPEPRGGFEMTLLRMLAFRPARPDEPSSAIPPASRPSHGHAAKPASAAQAKPSAQPLPSKPAVPAAKEDGKPQVVETRPTAHQPTPEAVSEPPLPPNAVGLSPKVSVPPFAKGGLGGILVTENSRAESNPPLNPPLLKGEEVNSTALPPPPRTLELTPASWPAVIEQLGLAGLTLQLANHCNVLAVDDERISLGLDPKAETILNPQLSSNLEQALQTHFARPELKLDIQSQTPTQETPAKLIMRRQRERQHQAELEIEQDPVVLSLKERLDARIVPGSIKPLD